MDIERLNRAVGLRDVGQLEESLREFEVLEYLTHDPVERATVVLNQATVLARMGRLEEAQARTRSAAALSPAPMVQCNALHSLAASLALAGHAEEAVATFERALKDYPEVLGVEQCRFLYEDIQVRRGLLLVQLGRPAEARGVLEECTSFDLELNDRWRVLYNLGRCYFELKDRNRAKETFTEFLKLQDRAGPAHVASAHFLLGTIYYNEAADGRALMEFEWLLPRADSAGISKQMLYTWLAKTHRQLGNRTEAKRYEALGRETGH